LEGSKTFQHAQREHRLAHRFEKIASVKNEQLDYHLKECDLTSSWKIKDIMTIMNNAFLSVLAVNS